MPKLHLLLLLLFQGGSVLQVPLSQIKVLIPRLQVRRA